MIDLVRGCTVILLRKWKRTLLTALSIAIGVGSVVLISSLGSTGINLINSEISHLGLKGMVLSPDSKLTDYRPNEDICQILMKESSVEYASGSSFESGLVRMHGLISNAVIWGVGQNYQQVISIPLLYGRYISAEETTSGGNVCLLDIQSAKEFYHRGNIVGKTLSLDYNGQRHNLEIVGIVESGGNGLQNMLGEYIPSFLYLPAKTFETITGKTGYNQIALTLNKNYPFLEENVISTIEHHSGIDDAFVLDDLSEKNQRLTNMLGNVSLTLSIIAVISLVVATIGTMTVMLAAVKERTREIGIKKSLGASNIRIMTEFLIESILISCFGTLLGSVISAVCIYTVGKMLPDIPFTISGAETSAIICIVLGTLFGIIPAYQAAKLDPIDALRSEI